MIRPISFTSPMPSLNSSSLRKYLPVIGILILVIIGSSLVLRKSSDVSVSTTKTQSSNFELAAPRKTMNLNRTFEFPVLDGKGEEISKMQYTIETVELRDEIIVKGQKATSVPGRVFLVLTIKIKNDLDKRLEINTRDYIRLSINNSEERLAFNVHSDPVEVDAISTKPTRLALPVDDVPNQKLTLYIGEITGTKEPVDLTF